MIKKYVPGIKNNNYYQAEVVSKLQNILYLCQKGKVNDTLSKKDGFKNLIDELIESYEKLESSLGTGEENVLDVYNNAIDSIKKINILIKKDSLTNLSEEVENLIFVLDYWSDILEGKVTYVENEIKHEKETKTRFKLKKKIDVLISLKENFYNNSVRLEKEITFFEKNISEINNSILKTNNERNISDLYKQIVTLKNNINTLYIRKTSYVACLSVLDLICVHAKELLESSKYSISDLTKAKILLDLKNIKNVLDEPEKTLLILKKINDGLQEVTNKTKRIEKTLDNFTKTTEVIDEQALLYKESLLRNKLSENSVATNIKKEIKD